ncbi:hypothetical protein CDAR_114831 [Caerostris darwini]|uniref:Uncharacterized protein n=1 Tax=Caerostris darwini TaxID=1538125 RepID=A0AAV4QZL3_9ARAC|nr:hypothetical protein CDAR_114831 [Caerostris darwini]
MNISRRMERRNCCFSEGFFNRPSISFSCGRPKLEKHLSKSKSHQSQTSQPHDTNEDCFVLKVTKVHVDIKFESASLLTYHIRDTYH